MIPNGKKNVIACSHVEKREVERAKGGHGPPQVVRYRHVLQGEQSGTNEDEDDQRAGDDRPKTPPGVPNRPLHPLLCTDHVRNPDRERRNAEHERFDAQPDREDHEQTEPCEREMAQPT